jgi:hypothetical protein
MSVPNWTPPPKRLPMLNVDATFFSTRSLTWI